jgi:phospho-N-acetylmuramoyl-pentapeptide-transferase
MLLELAQWLAKEVRLFNVFNYITLRAVLACLTALAVSLILGPYVIRKLTAYKIGQAVREEGPRSHLTKAGTPTMGGALILVSMCLTTLLWGDLSNRFVWVVLLVTLAFGTVGWIDDYRKVVHRNPRGLPARWKFFWQAVIGLSAALYLGTLTQAIPSLNELIVPFFKHVAYPLGAVGFVVLTFFVIVGTSNAVNLTDGLDGLAAGCASIVLLSYIAITFTTRQTDLALIGACLGGACIGFLWFNSFPASIFMGDTGSLGLGGAIAALAVMTKTEVLLIVLGGIFVIEALSVLVQVFSFQMFRKRVFLMAPIHHHFELLAWSETKIILRFWIVAAVCSAIGFTLYQQS